MEFNADGVIPAGIHNCALNDFYSFFVEGFPASQKRRPIYDALINYLRSLSNRYTPYEIWIDGSYVTSKINPNDVDLVVFLNCEDLISANSDSEFVNNAPLEYIDKYISLAVNEYNESRISPEDYQKHGINKRNYWRGQFGFDRNDTPKGIVKIDWNEIQSLLDGGEE